MITDINKDTWCVNAFHGMSCNNNGTTKLCCMYKPESDDPKLVLGDSTINEHFNSNVFETVRNDLLLGIRNNRCSYCWNEETAGRKSKRLRDNEKYYNRLIPYNGLSYLELNLGNICNLSCRTCNPYISSGWIKESYDTSHNTNDISFKDFTEKFRTFHQSYDDTSVFWDELKVQLSNIKQFDFYGGEPFMSKKMWDILKFSQEADLSKDIELHYNTNGTHYPIEELQLWKYFKEVNISFSIDGIGEQFEYMRYPAKWDTVKNNMDKFIEIGKEYGNIHYSWCITLSVSNIYNVPEILDYYYTHYKEKNVGMYLNLVHGPDHHNIRILPENIKNIIEQRLLKVPKEYKQAWDHIPGIINFMNSKDSNKQEFQKFIEITNTSDEYRNQNFKETFKEYGEYFDPISF